MKLNDDITLSIAAAVSDVLEGKVKEEGKYPHDMFHPETGEKKVAKDEAEHKALADKGYTHDKPEVDEVAEPKAKGEKDFKDAHKTKKSGEKEDGTVVKEGTYSNDYLFDGSDKNQIKDQIKQWEKKFGVKVKTDGRMGGTVTGDNKKLEKFLMTNYDKNDTKALMTKGTIPGERGVTFKEEVTITLDEAKLKAGKGKVKVDIDHTGDGIPAAEKQFKLKFKKHSRNGYDVSGEKKNILAFLQSNLYSMDTDDIEELFPELLEAKSKFQKPQVKKAVALALKMGGNMTGAVKKIEQMVKGLSKDAEVAAALQLANESVTEEVLDEAHAINKTKTKMQEDKERYQKFFKSALKKFGVTSPGDLEGEKKKEFFNYVDKNYEADNETDKDEGTLPPALQKAIDKKNGKKTDDDEVKEETIAEASITTFTDFDDYPIEKQAKALKLKVKAMKGKGNNSQGHDKMTLTGSESDLIKYFIKYMGADRNAKFSDIKSEFNESLDEGTYHNDYLWDGSSSSDIKADIKNWTKKYPGLKFKHTGRGGGDVIGATKKIEKFLLDDPNMDKSDVKELLKHGTLGPYFGGIHFDEGTIAEAQIRTSFESDEMKNVGGDKAAKKLKIKVSFKKGKGDGMMGSDAGIFTGDEKNLVKYFQDFMGFEGKTFKELQKEYS